MLAMAVVNECAGRVREPKKTATPMSIPDTNRAVPHEIRGESQSNTKYKENAEIQCKIKLGCQSYVTKMVTNVLQGEAEKRKGLLVPIW
jgi:hypothetical protein